jgi:hypothetical protein
MNYFLMVLNAKRWFEKKVIANFCSLKILVSISSAICLSCKTMFAKSNDAIANDYFS